MPASLCVFAAESSPVSFCPLYALPFVLCEAVPLCCTLEFDAPPLDASAFSRTDCSISFCIPPSAVQSPASAEAESAAAVLPLPTVLNAGISPPPSTTSTTTAAAATIVNTGRRRIGFCGATTRTVSSCRRRSIMLSCSPAGGSVSSTASILCICSRSSFSAAHDGHSARCSSSFCFSESVRVPSTLFEQSCSKYSSSFMLLASFHIFRRRQMKKVPSFE